MNGGRSVRMKVRIKLEDYVPCEISLHISIDRATY